MNDESKVLHCPFCGSDDISDGEVLSCDAAGRNTTTQSECMGCGALGPKAALQPDEVDYGCLKAIDAWNRRAPKDPPMNTADLLAGVPADAWRVTGGRRTVDRVFATEPAADLSIHTRNDGSHKQPAYTAATLAPVLDPLLARLEAAEKDAARYRWLREHTVATGLSRFTDRQGTQFLDAAIDAAIANAIAKEQDRSRYWLTAELPIPEPVTVQAEVEKDTP